MMSSLYYIYIYCIFGPVKYINVIVIKRMPTQKITVSFIIASLSNRMGKYSSMMCACAWLIIRVLGVWLGTEMIISECIVVRYRYMYII